MIYYKKQKLTSIDNIYDKFNKNEFKSPYRSTIPLIALFKNNQLTNIKSINSNSISNINYFFEY
jgi:hypothetical protein